MWIDIAMWIFPVNNFHFAIVLFRQFPSAGNHRTLHEKSYDDYTGAGLHFDEDVQIFIPIKLEN